MSDKYQPTAPKTPGIPLSTTWKCLLLFYLLALGLNGVSLHYNNETTLVFGPVRNFWVAATKPVDQVCRALHLDAPRNWLYKNIGKPLNTALDQH